MRVGVLTGGGDCPGLNAVIRSVVRKAVDGYGAEVVGFRDGWRGPLEDLYEPLTVESTRGILPRGGTILGSSRTNIFKREDGPEMVRQALARHGLDGLIAIGGEDTLGAASRLFQLGVNVIGVPKTIDNDLGATDQTFGFDTALQVATEEAHTAGIGPAQSKDRTQQHRLAHARTPDDTEHVAFIDLHVEPGVHGLSAEARHNTPYLEQRGHQMSSRRNSTANSASAVSTPNIEITTASVVRRPSSRDEPLTRMPQ